MSVMVRVEAALPDVADALPEALVLAEPEAAAEPDPLEQPAKPATNAAAAAPEPTLTN